ncbi:RNA polymerase sigma factor sigX [Brevibacillus laterosporus GI-9]|nr:RNA polymerase sigma factor sigX [Brevibacillus laterosporus GI-9]
MAFYPGGNYALTEDEKEHIQHIYRTHYQDIYQFLVFFTGDQNEAEDLTQEVFIRLFRSLSSYDGRSPLKLYILSIARYTAIDHYRKKKLKYVFSDYWIKKIPATFGLPEKELQHKELQQNLQQIFQSLKPKHRMVIILRGLRELSIKETAEILGCSEAKVKVDYHRALKIMQKKCLIPTMGGLYDELAK